MGTLYSNAIRPLSGTTDLITLASGGGGNVGLGTSSPGAKLHVSRTGGGNVAYFDSDSTSAGIQLSANSKSWDLFNSNGIANQGFGIYDRTQSVYRLAIDGTSGNIGVGTTAPSQKLSLAGAGGTSCFMSINAPSYGTANIGMTDTGLRLQTTGTTSGDDADIYFHTDNGGEVLRITDDGTLDLKAQKLKLNGISGSNGDVLTSDGSGGVSWSAGGGGGGGGTAEQTLFTSSGTWTKPTGVSLIHVRVYGGGGGGNGSEPGGHGGVIQNYIDVSSVSSVTVTVGAAGSAGKSNANYTDYVAAGAGGNSSFGGYLQGNGGSAADAYGWNNPTDGAVSSNSGLSVEIPKANIPNDVYGKAGDCNSCGGYSVWGNAGGAGLVVVNVIG